MTKRYKALLLGVCMLALIGGAAAITSCALLAGTIDGPCDPPASVSGQSPDPIGRRRGNCQPTGAVCCRRSANATQTLCTYPEDCYDAPFQGKCAIPADCSDSQACTGAKCQCPSSQPPCQLDAGLCCEDGETCVLGKCFVVDAGSP